MSDDEHRSGKLELCTKEMTDLEVRLKYRKSEEDDWTKVEDKALRKRIQDRLAKRKSRIFPALQFGLREIDQIARKERSKAREKARERDYLLQEAI